WWPLPAGQPTARGSPGSRRASTNAWWEILKKGSAGITRGGRPGFQAVSGDDLTPQNVVTFALCRPPKAVQEIYRGGSSRVADKPCDGTSTRSRRPCASTQKSASAASPLTANREAVAGFPATVILSSPFGITLAVAAWAAPGSITWMRPLRAAS